MNQKNATPITISQYARASWKLALMDRAANRPSMGPLMSFANFVVGPTLG